MDLISAGIAACEAEQNLNYAIIVAADTWLLNTNYVENLIEQIEKEKKVLACCAWGRQKGEIST